MLYVLFGQMGLSQYRLAKEISVPARRINEIVKGRRTISVDTAYRLARYFQTSPEFWLNLQTKYDLETYKNRNLLKVEKEVGIFNLNLTTAKLSYNV